MNEAERSEAIVVSIDDYNPALDNVDVGQEVRQEIVQTDRVIAKFDEPRMVVFTRQLGGGDGKTRVKNECYLCCIMESGKLVCTKMGNAACPQ